MNGEIEYPGIQQPAARERYVRVWGSLKALVETLPEKAWNALSFNVYFSLAGVCVRSGFKYYLKSFKYLDHLL
jgi:hypothetical protein